MKPPPSRRKPLSGMRNLALKRHDQVVSYLITFHYRMRIPLSEISPLSYLVEFEERVELM